jgi:periplasmic protein TonB
VSAMGSLSDCILENDPETRKRARRLRAKSLAVSLAFEAALLAAVLFGPLPNPGVLGPRLIITPLPPPSGGNGPAEHAPRSINHQSPAQNETPRRCLVCSQPARPQTSGNRAGTNGEAPVIGTSFDFDANGFGPVIRGTEANNPAPMEIIKPEPPPHISPLHISEGVMEAALLHRVLPQYPTTARIARISGAVRLRAMIGTDGRIREIAVISGSAFLQAAAIAAVRKWRYRPTLLNGEAVEVETLITVNFVLDQP